MADWSGLMRSRPGRVVVSAVLAFVVVGVTSGCSITVNTPQPPQGTPVTSEAAVVTPPDATTLAASPSPSPSDAPASQTTVTVTQAPTTSSEQRAIITQATLNMGETAQLANWDVTVLRGEYGKDGISYGWKVKVCYVTSSDLAENGKIRVSDKPWSAIFQDLEGGDNPRVTVPIRDFDRDHAYRPDYLDTTLALGECNLGWIGIVHGNPDLAWYGITYEPSTGERIVWLS